MDGVVERIGVFALVGLGSGFVSGLFGIGGGIVRIPLFVYLLPLFGVAQSVMMHVALGTSMALVLPSAIAATRKQLALGNLDLAFFRTWAVGILIGVLVGTALLPYASTELLQVIFAIFMVTVGVYEGFLKDRLVFARTPPQGAKKVGVAWSVPLSSNRSTVAKTSAATCANVSRDTAAPSMATRRGSAVGAAPRTSGVARRASSPGSARLGFTEHSSTGSNARQSSLQATHGRMSAARPPSSLRGM